MWIYLLAQRQLRKVNLIAVEVLVIEIENPEDPALEDEAEINRTGIR